MDLRGSGLSETDAKFLTERLIIELQRTDVFDVLERDKMDEILKEQGFQQTGACDQASCLVEAGRLLPVQKMIGGSVGKFGETYSVQIKMIDLKTAKVEKTAINDFSQKMDYLLTDGMKFVATTIAENGNYKTKPNEISMRPQEDIADSSVASVIKIKKDNRFFGRDERDWQLYEMMGAQKNDRVIINKGSTDGMKKDDLYKIFRVKEKNVIVDPITKKVLNKETKIIEVAYLKVENSEDKYAECSIFNSKKPIEVGDKVYKTTTHNK
jgi:TolB-like protein